MPLPLSPFLFNHSSQSFPSSPCLLHSLSHPPTIPLLIFLFFSSPFLFPFCLLSIVPLPSLLFLPPSLSISPLPTFFIHSPISLHAATIPLHSLLPAFIFFLSSHHHHYFSLHFLLHVNPHSLSFLPSYHHSSFLPLHFFSFPFLLPPFSSFTIIPIHFPPFFPPFLFVSFPFSHQHFFPIPSLPLISIHIHFIPLPFLVTPFLFTFTPYISLLTSDSLPFSSSIQFLFTPTLLTTIPFRFLLSFSLTFQFIAFFSAHYFSSTLPSLLFYSLKRRYFLHGRTS